MTRKPERNWDVIVLGAGAAGCMAAITAARSGARVLLLEQNDRIGKKILATGNGKCNYTNAKMTPEAFRGNRRMAANALEEFGLRDTLGFFHGIGIYPKCKNGYYYPNSQTASSVRNALEAELARCGVEIRTGIHVSNIIISDITSDDKAQYINTYRVRFSIEEENNIGKKNDGSRQAKENEIKDEFKNFQLVTTDEIFLCDRLILATGLLASPKSGSNGSAFGMIKSLGHHFTDIVPALCGFYAKGLDFKKVAGVRIDARVTLYIEGKEAFTDSDGNIVLSREYACRASSPQRDDSPGDDNKGKCLQAVTDTGEVQLTDYGISGIPVFQISRYASYALKQGQKAEVSIDFLPHITPTEVKEEILRRFHKTAEAEEKMLSHFHKTAEAEEKMLRHFPKTAEAEEEMPRHFYKTDTGTTHQLEDHAAACLNGLLNEKLIPVLLKLAGISPSAGVAEVPMHKIEKLCRVCKDCRVTLTASRDFEFAQVCAGGIVSEEVDERTLESKFVPGLYFAGELLDVDGICGGYNLQWAWSSGYVAGRNAASDCNYG